jgi:hypothetical protein
VQKNLFLNLSYQLQLTKSESKSGIGIFGSFWLIWLFFFHGMAFFLVGGDFLNMKIIRETTEIEVLFSKLIKLPFHEIWLCL